MILEGPPRKKKSWITRGLFAFLAVVISGIGAAEGVARFYLGLGDPPLMIVDPKIEYMFKPGGIYSRFGNVVRYNSYGMRSDEFPKTKQIKDEVRVLFIGDSIIEGGAQVDQPLLATERVKVGLAEKLQKPVVVGNVSAKSWGPPNMLAYAETYGLFDADVCVLVLSSHDVIDIPSFKPIVGVNPDFPDHTPWLAVEEVATRYLPRYIPALRKTDVPPEIPTQAIIQDAEDQSMKALGQLIDMLSSAGIPVLLVQHLEKEELAGEPLAGHEKIAAVAAGHHATVIQLGPSLKALQSSGANPYLDSIHLTVQGQQALADTVLPAVLSLLKPGNPHAAGVVGKSGIQP